MYPHSLLADAIAELRCEAARGAGDISNHAGSVIAAFGVIATLAAAPPAAIITAGRFATRRSAQGLTAAGHGEIVAAPMIFYRACR